MASIALGQLSTFCHSLVCSIWYILCQPPLERLDPRVTANDGVVAVDDDGLSEAKQFETLDEIVQALLGNPARILLVSLQLRELPGFDGPLNQCRFSVISIADGTLLYSPFPDRPEVTMAHLTVVFAEGRTASFFVSGKTLREVITQAAIENSDIAEFLTRPGLRPLTVLLNDRDISAQVVDTEDLPIQPDDRITIFTPQPSPLTEPLPAAASLAITLASPHHTVEDVAFLVQSIDNLVMASVWGALAQESLEDETLAWAKSVASANLQQSPKSSIRFFPYLGSIRRDTIQWHPEDYDPFDPLDIGVQAGLNTWLRRVLLRADPKRYEQLFSFAEIHRVEHHSPLLLETVVLLSAGLIALPVALFYGTMKAVYYIQRDEANLAIRQTEVKLKEEVTCPHL